MILKLIAMTSAGDKMCDFRKAGNSMVVLED